MSKQTDKEHHDKLLAEEKAEAVRKAKEIALAEHKKKAAAEADRVALLERKKLEKDGTKIQAGVAEKAKADADAEVVADQKAKEKAEAKVAADLKAKQDKEARETVTVNKKELAKLFYTLVAGSAAMGQWTQLAGRNRVARMLGAKTDAECEKIWHEYRALAQT